VRISTISTANDLADSTAGHGINYQAIGYQGTLLLGA
jgi:hypothetical protein